MQDNATTTTPITLSLEKYSPERDNPQTLYVTNGRGSQRPVALLSAFPGHLDRSEFFELLTTLPRLLTLMEKCVEGNLLGHLDSAPTVHELHEAHAAVEYWRSVMGLL